MAEVRDPSPRRRPPAKTPEARENQMMALATDLAEKQMREGTASAQVITHYLKLATQKERLEREHLQARIRLEEAKVQSHGSDQKIEELYNNAMNAMRSYSGLEMPDDDE